MKLSGHIEFSITQVTSEQVIGEMPIQAGILNPFGTANAGAIIWFADVCATVLAFGGNEIIAGAAGFPLAINLSAALLGNQKEGKFVATSEFVKRGRQVTVVRTTVTGEGGRLVADVTTSHVASK
jgi:1,4-dihydroxy-2-naphthoyl-CoA hydrolase